MANKLSYKGTVYFYTVNNGKKVLIKKYNKGTIALAKLFAYALIGDNVKNLAPHKLDIFDEYDSSILVAPIEPLNDVHVEYSKQDLSEEKQKYNNYRAYFSITISKDAIRTNSASKAKRVALLDNNGVELADIEVDGAEFALIFSNNDNLLIVWQMELIYDEMTEEIPNEYR